jgi:hypothetical protein
VASQGKVNEEWTTATHAAQLLRLGEQPEPVRAAA